ncbi:hypothetical protein LR48_Vigan03g178300 [Vigna angularis]|uniref:Uncharacterized protein n=1 Tax=Phaseolus angularis TaxID=3914 RepID=A0A0L9U6K6_PHAAN|nr:hypothetical protein LR48_Vigan03g178300 [Vigna angularis]
MPKPTAHCLGALFGALSATFPEEPRLLTLQVKVSANFSVVARPSALSGELSASEMGLGFVSVLIPLYLKDPDALGLVSLAEEVQQHTLPLFEGGFGCGSFHLQLLGFFYLILLHCTSSSTMTMGNFYLLLGDDITL